MSSILLERFREGVEALITNERLHQGILTNRAIEEIADRLLIEAEVKDYFDRMVYATAIHYDATLLTEDEKLHRTTRCKELPKPTRILKWSRIEKDLHP